MRFLGKTFTAVMTGIAIQSIAFATDNTQISRYEQAKLRLSYEGNVGNLLQQLSQRLKVGFIAYDIDTMRKVSIQPDKEMTIKAINEQIESQLLDADVRFEKIGNRLFIIISAREGEPLLQTMPEEQFVGDISFDGEDQDSSDQNLSVPTRLQHIFNIATDEVRLANVKDKKVPRYKITTKDNLALKNIRVTALGTFLVFDHKVDASKLKVKGKFEDMAQGENIIAILHQNSEAPNKIEIENALGKRLVLEAQKVTQPKIEKKKSKK